MSDTSKDFLLAEYAALREEILKRIELQHQIISLVLIVTGTIVTAGIQFNSVASLLIYPPISLFLASLWLRNNASMRQIAIYIKDEIESRLTTGNLGWEHVSPSFEFSSVHKYFGSLERLTARGVFIGTQLITIALSIPKIASTYDQIILFTISIISTIVTIPLLTRPSFNRKQSKLREVSILEELLLNNEK